MQLWVGRLFQLGQREGVYPQGQAKAQVDHAAMPFWRVRRRRRTSLPSRRSLGCGSMVMASGFTQRAYFKARLAAASNKSSPLEVDLLARRVRKQCCWTLH